MKALVTGSAGFIGSQVAHTLDSAGYEVYGLDLAAGTDVRRDMDSVPAADLVVHCAAVVGGRKVMDWSPLDHAFNLETDAAFFRWARSARPHRIVYFSSSCAYPAQLGGVKGRLLKEDDISFRHPRWPDQLYGWAKLTGELLAQTAGDAGIPVSIVRPFSVYGPGMREGFAVRGFLGQIQRRADPVEIWGSADQTRDYIHVADVADAVLAVASQGIDGPVNLGTGRATSLTDLVTMMGHAAGYAPAVKVATAMPAGFPWLVADATLLNSFCPPKIQIEDYLAQVLA